MAWGNQSASSSNCQGCNLCLKKMTFQYCFDGSIKKVNHLSVSSPRTWGCFLCSLSDSSSGGVFPTHVGVFLRMREVPQRLSRLPHARGGVSSVGIGFLGRQSLPHARGGVSLQVTVTTSSTGSSPRTWGCFRRERLQSFCSTVFPTHVGVFLRCPTPLK